MTEIITYDNMIGRTFTSIKGAKIYSDNLTFIATDGSEFNFYDGEAGLGNNVSVYIDDICGDITNLIGRPILQTECISNKNSDETWTFYKFSTVKGTVTIKWRGTSNGYYSEEVSYSESIKLKPVLKLLNNLK